MKITKKIFNKILFAFIVALVFSFINRCSVKALNKKNILLDIPNTDIQAAFSVDTDEYPYYYGIMRTTDNNTHFRIEFYYSAEQLFYYSGQSTYCGLNSGYEENPCYGFFGKSTSTTPVYRYYKTWDTTTGHLYTANNEPEVVNGSNMGGYRSYFIAASYNFTDFAENAASFYGYTSYGFPIINDYYVPWVLSHDLYNNNNDLILTTQYVNEYVAPDIDFKIDFVTINSSDNSQEDYGNDMTITGVAAAIKYSPCDNELYNYYYAFVESDNDPIEWTQVTNEQKCMGSYVAHSNGSLLAKIENKSGGLQYSKTFNINNLGTLSTFAVNNNKFSSFLTDISNNINYGGPISGLTTIPINLMSTLYNSFNGTCVPYNLGTILGHNIVINCFTLQSILGSSITSVIDMICAFGIYYHLVLLIISIYRKVMNLDELDDYLPQHMYHPQHGSYEDLHS